MQLRESHGRQHHKLHPAGAERGVCGWIRTLVAAVMRAEMWFRVTIPIVGSVKLTQQSVDVRVLARRFGTETVPQMDNGTL